MNIHSSLTPNSQKLGGKKRQNFLQWMNSYKLCQIGSIPWNATQQ